MNKSVTSKPGRPPRIPLMRLTLPSIRAATLLAAAVLAATAPLAAREGDSEQPINVSANRSEYNERSGTQILRGNVEITQGSMRIRADEIIVTLADGALGKVEGSGSPVRFEQENDAGELMQGSARRIVYDAIAGTLILSGGATLSQPRQKLDSESITFDTRSQTVKAEGNGSEGSGGRVSLQIRPPTSDER
ncbi:MAG: lipopolysaccharide transport periplasmic protein LptA [Gammaproteobacteria bacterium]|nr:MAG: lipopolysaccharide transport periplasmic protein LptA [Gammaproteobacteria bacterium]PIE37603.1 MAG: lipopolysaccharide transport periplasmic protein LptA [Gammaproteobacteria bacterium]